MPELTQIFMRWVSQAEGPTKTLVFDTTLADPGLYYLRTDAYGPLRKVFTIRVKFPAPVALQLSRRYRFDSFIVNPRDIPVTGQNSLDNRVSQHALSARAK
jgi:hypothetical protein